jgi:hypothetical protein
MEEFTRSYGVWILLAGVFLATHCFGMKCGHGLGAALNDGSAKPREEDGRTTTGRQV